MNNETLFRRDQYLCNILVCMYVPGEKVDLAYTKITSTMYVLTDMDTSHVKIHKGQIVYDLAELLQTNSEALYTDAPF